MLERPISRYFFIPGSGKLRFRNFSEPGNPGSEPSLLKLSFRIAMIKNSPKNIHQNTLKIATKWQIWDKLPVSYEYSIFKRNRKPSMPKIRQKILRFCTLLGTKFPGSCHFHFPVPVLNLEPGFPVPIPVLDALIPMLM